MTFKGRPAMSLFANHKLVRASIKNAPDQLRDLVEGVINLHLPPHQFEILKVAEESERNIAYKLLGELAL
jgi:hypothetical protein